jgi:hypothetical protein
MAKEKWEGKPPAEWTLEEALDFFHDSPWSDEVTVYQTTGRILGVMWNGQKVVYQESPNLPPRQYSPAPVRLEPEALQATYGVRWDSAQIVQAGLARLQEISPVHGEMQAPAPEVPGDEIVLTARVVEPPREPASERLNRPLIVDESGRPVRQEQEPTTPDLFAGLSDGELAAAAELRVRDGETVKPVRVVAHGLGTSEGYTFYFPRQLPPQARQAEFVFKGRGGTELKVKFKLEEMTVAGKPDY